ncbi:MAG TPA: heavy metal-binding domain-containing protein, partial [Chromatiaceae bacterium]|nr:heavy metal-binding domain-containing protein [Chromatiaceae bacterium]
MNIKAPLVLGLCLVAAAGGYWLAQQQTGPAPAPSEQHQHAASVAETEAQVYQCPMHPWIKSDRLGDRCTICGMELVAAGGGKAAATEVDPNLVTLTPAQAAVTGVQTAEVKRGSVTRTLRVSGVIDDDDTRHRILSARVPGRIEQLQVNY